MNLQHTDIAKAFAALSHSKRIIILEYLLGNSPLQTTFGELQQATKIPASTLTHHIREMERGGVVVREPQGRTTNLKLDTVHLLGILEYLTERCCNNQVVEIKENPNE